MKTVRLFLAFALITFGIGWINHAQSVPQLINYQGRLTDAAGRPVSDGIYGIKFTIWSSPTGNDANVTIWSQELPNVAVVGGVFNAILGAGSDLTAAFNERDRFLGLTITRSNGSAVQDPKELAPRQQILSSPFALRADVAASVIDGSVTSAKIARGAVGTEQIAEGAVGPAQLASNAVVFAPRSIQVFTSSGTWTRPPGVSSVYVKVVGPGGRGASPGDSKAGGGGGGGGYAEGIIRVEGDVAVTIGSTCSFAGLTTISATAGGDSPDQAGGVGGVGSGGMLNLTGSKGQGAATGVNNLQGGSGGGTPLGSGGGGAGFNQQNSTFYAAGDGGGFGGGGGGATNVGRNAGAGAPGAVIVYY